MISGVEECNDVLIDRCLSNCRQYWLNYGFEISHQDGLSLHRSGVNSPMLNGVFRVDDPRMQCLEDAKVKLVGTASAWWVGPDSHPSSVDALLAAGGILHGSMPVFVRSLKDLPDIPMPDGVSISEVEGNAALDEWVECFSPSLGVPQTELNQMKLVERNRLDRPGSYRRFAAHYDGRVIGTSAMFDTDDIAGIYVCSTAESFRRRGIGSALTVAASRAGVEHGLSHATLQATTMGEPVYLNLGFRKISEYRCVVFPERGPE